MDVFESISGDYLKAPITWQLLYRMVSVIDTYQISILLDKPRSTNGSGRLIRNERAYRRAGGTSNYKATGLPDNVYKAWRYFSMNAEAINKFLYNAKARAAAKGVFVYLKSSGTSEARKKILFNSVHYGAMLAQITEFALNLTMRLAPSDRFTIRSYGTSMKSSGSERSLQIYRGNDLVHSINRDSWPEMRELVESLK